jgi:flagellar hook protein FlgE
MSFNISLSGLNAASSDLDVTSNNIANVGTTGFKGSRAEFADIFAASALGTTNTAVGSGVLLASVSQQFSQGNLEFTDSNLDIAVSGEGFFVLKPNATSSELSYTRAGAFQVDQAGNVVTNQGQLLQVFPVNASGTVTSTSLSGTIPLQVPSTVGSPNATTQVDLNLNFPAGLTQALTPAAARAALDAELAANPASPNPSTFHNSTSATVFDSQGTSHILTMYFVMVDDINNTWDVRSTLDGVVMPPTAGEVLDFDAAGALNTGAPTSTLGNIAYNAFPLTNGAAPISLAVDFRNGANTVTQEAQGGFSVQSLSQDGFSTGRLTGLNISNEGLVTASFTNGQTTAIGKIALARFDNPQGLNQTGNTSWVETTDSGAVQAGEAGTGNFGFMQAGALESSNVDLTQQLVNLITAQRNFQANSKAIETSNTITQTIINIR